jgi:hypothetical protein
MPYIDVTVDVDLDDFDDQELIDELEKRGWWVSPNTKWEPLELTDQQIDWICEKIMSENLDATDMVAKDIYDELRKK